MDAITPTAVALKNVARRFVTPAGEIAWEFLNPVRGGPGDRRIPILASGQRFTAGELDSWLPQH